MNQTIEPAPLPTGEAAPVPLPGTEAAARGGQAALRPLTVVLHLHKTAGTTLQQNFARNYREGAYVPLYRHEFGFPSDWIHGADLEKVKAHIRRHRAAECFFGHLAYYGLHTELPPVEPRYVCFFREPVSRVVSLYTYFKKSLPPDHPLRLEIEEGNWTLEEWLEKCAYLGLDNGMVRGLLWGRHPEVILQRELTEQHFQLAAEVLRSLWFVGLTGTFEDDFLVLAARLGFRHFDLEQRANVSREKLQPSHATLEGIAVRNTLDARLYELAQEIHDTIQNDPSYARDRDLGARRRELDWKFQRAAGKAGKVWRGIKRRLPGSHGP